MKKLLVLAVVLLGAILPAAAQVEVSVNAGVGAAGWIGSDADNTDMKFGYRVGLGLDAPINNTWGFRSGLNFEGLGAKIGGVTAKPLYLEIPLMATAKMPVVDAVDVVFNFGPYIGFGVGGKLSSDLGSSDAFGDYGMNRFDAGLGLGAGVDVDHFRFGLDTRFGLTKVYDDSNIHNFALLFSVGYKF